MCTYTDPNLFNIAVKHSSGDLIWMCKAEQYLNFKHGLWLKNKSMKSRIPKQNHLSSSWQVSPVKIVKPKIEILASKKSHSNKSIQENVLRLLNTLDLP